MSGIDQILSRDSFLLSVELRLFWAVALLYGISLLLYIFHIVTRQTSVGRSGFYILWAASILHVCVIILRTVEAGRAPYQTLYESLSWFACSAAIAYIIVASRFKDVHLPGLFVTAISLCACLYALLTRSPAVDTLTPALNSYWFEIHVALAFLSYAVFTVGASIEVTYLLINPILRKGRVAYGLTTESIDKFHASAHRLVMFGFPLLTFTIFSGAAWANEAWGRYWSWDPKETWSLLTWTVFAAYLHSRATPSLKGAPASVINLLGFVCMIVTFLGVNWIAKFLGIPSLHVYAV